MKNPRCIYVLYRIYSWMPAVSFIKVTSKWWLWTLHVESVSAVFYPAVFLHNSRVLYSIARYEKNEQVHQADLFKRQTLTFIFQHGFYIHLSIYPIYQIKSMRENELPRSLHRSSVVTRQNSTTVKSFLLNNTFSTLSKLITWNMYCRLSEIIVLIYWMHFWVNCVGAKLFSPEQTNDRTPGCFQR